MPITNRTVIAEPIAKRLPAAADHPPVGEHEPHGDQQDEQHLEEVREPGRVLERHRGVRVEEAAAVRAELLDDLLGGDRTERDLLADARRRGHRRVVPERLDHALRGEHDRADDRDRQQHVEQRARQVDPEVSDAVAAAADDSADQGDDDGDPDRRREEVLHGEAGHLREVGHRRLAAVVLPVRVRHERRDGVERDVPGRRVEPLRVERQVVLGAQDHVQEDPAGEREEQHVARVALPVVLLLGIDAEAAVEQALERPDDACQEDPLARVDLRHDSCRAAPRSANSTTRKTMICSQPCAVT